MCFSVAGNVFTAVWSCIHSAQVCCSASTHVSCWGENRLLDVLSACLPRGAPARCCTSAALFRNHRRWGVRSISWLKREIQAIRSGATVASSPNGFGWGIFTQKLHQSNGFNVMSPSYRSQLRRSTKWPLQETLETGCWNTITKQRERNDKYWSFEREQ